MSNNIRIKKSRDRKTEKSGEHNPTIVAALLAAVSAIVVGVFSNWDKIFPPTQTYQAPPSKISTTPPPSEISTSLTGQSSKPNPPIAPIGSSPAPTPAVVPTQPNDSFPPSTQPVVPTQPTPSVSVKPPTLPGSTKSGVEIMQPSDGEVVERNVNVSGTFADLANGDSIWVYVFPSIEQKYYPSKVSYDSRSGKWQVPVIVGSIAKEAGSATFEIGVFAANSRHTARLLSGGEKGLDRLPSDVASLQSVTVKRK